MAGQKSTMGKVKEAVQDAASSVAHAAEQHVIQPVGKALGLTGGTKDDDGTAKSPAVKAAAPKKSVAVRMMTRSVAGKTPTPAKGKARRATDAAKPSQKPIAGSGSKGPRRGASKGR